MKAIALKKYLVSKINLIDDDSILDEIKEIVDKKETVYVLSNYHLEKLAKSRQQIEEGDFLTQDEMDKKVEEWLNEK
ncbi:hypothetical protein C3L50_10405 [Flavobacterium alvei]|uniref:Uncharacterized protein n=1 Tax=Flavobacterium alvei TaxID=2080416 RepID=A0A2S5AAF4_9FLAO|nr:hypothetical protein [Flavobacterium alvei]POY39570.1 hypothetical protein C3L50_10405 [Flavobacterium alvei]